MKALLTEGPKEKIWIGFLLLALGLTLSACDKAKKPYEEAESLFNKSDYGSAKSKAAEVAQKAPNSKYLPQARAILEKVEKIESLSKTATVSIEKGDYETGIKAYKETLSLASNDKTAAEGIRSAEAILSEAKETGNTNILDAKDARIIINVKKADFMRDETGKRLPPSGLYIPFVDFTVENNRDNAIKIHSAEIRHRMVTDADLMAKSEPVYTQILSDEKIPYNMILPKGKATKTISSITENGSRRCTFIADRIPVAIIEILLSTSEGKVYRKVGIHWKTKARTYVFK